MKHRVVTRTLGRQTAHRLAMLGNLALSLLTNLGAGMSDEALSHAHTLTSAAASASTAVRLLRAIVADLPPARDD